MNATKHAEEAERYLEAVRAHLGGSQRPEVAELLDDLQQHLIEVASEHDGPLADRLGTPERYAEELRASAGLPADNASRTLVRRAWSVAAGRVTHRIDGWLATSWVSWLRESGMVWLVLRGYAAAMAWGVVVTWHIGLSTFPVPHIGGNDTFSLFATAALIAASVAAGKRGRGGNRRLDVLCNLALVVLGIAALLDLRTMSEQLMRNDAHEATEGAVANGTDGFLSHHDGSPITNLYPYDAQGRLLENVMLYDQNGRPVELMVSYTSDGRPVFTSYPLDRADRPVMHAYPQRQVPGRTGEGLDQDARDWGRRPRPDVPRLADESPVADPEASPTASSSPSAQPPSPG